MLRKTDERMIPLTALRFDPEVEIRQADADTVEKYAACFDELPPIDVFEVRGLTVADGMNRIEAARTLGRDKIRASLYSGTLEDAIEFAAVANAKHGRPLKGDELGRAIVHLSRLPQYRFESNGKAPHQSKIAKALGISQPTVRYYLEAQGAREKLKNSIISTDSLSTAQVYEISQGPEEDWETLAEKAVKGTLKTSKAVRDEIQIDAILKNKGIKDALQAMARITQAFKAKDFENFTLGDVDRLRLETVRRFLSHLEGR